MEINMAEEITRETFLKEWTETKKMMTAHMDGQKTLCDTMGIARKDLGVLYQNAYNAFQAEDYPQAETLFFSLFLWNCKDYSFQVGLGATYEAQEKFDNALAMYTLAMMTKEQEPELLFRTGKCLLAMGKKSEAKIVFEIAGEATGGGNNFARLGSIEKSRNILTLLTD
ncbi:MAG: hypothetical protein JEZ12_11535 [Desulfobacterium sp.]|nr:hypothetical protein [Desulfobacterium sp.]